MVLSWCPVAFLSLMVGSQSIKAVCLHSGEHRLMRDEVFCLHGVHGCPLSASPMRECFSNFWRFLQGEFTDDGVETHFELGSKDAYIIAVSSGKRREGIIHSLIVNGNEVPPAME